MKKSKYEGASAKDKKSFAPFLSEDEELVLATGYGSNYMRHKFAYYLMLPGFIFILVGIGLIYLKSRPDFTSQDLAMGLLLGLFLASLTALIQSIWHYHSHRYLLTTRRVIIKNGFFAVKLTSALYDKITHIEVDQTFWDRIIMKHGNVLINTAGGNRDELKINNVDEPIAFKNLLERLINRERERFGSPTGPVVTLEGEIVD
jgi:membrane protein YdbS with pleckstrin-like domain